MFVTMLILNQLALYSNLRFQCLNDVLVTDCKTLLVGVVLQSSVLASGYLYFDPMHLGHGTVIWSFKESWMGVSCCDSRDVALGLLILAERFLSVNIRFYLNLLEKR